MSRDTLERPRTGIGRRHRATSSSTSVAPTLPTTAPITEPVSRTSTTMSTRRAVHRAALTAATSRNRPAPREHVAMRTRDVEQDEIDREHGEIGRERRHAEQARDRNARRRDDERRSPADAEPPPKHSGRDRAPLVRLAHELHRRTGQQRGRREGEPGDERRRDGEQSVPARAERARQHGRGDQTGREQDELRGEAEHHAVGEAEVRPARRGRSGSRHHAVATRCTIPSAT